MLDNRDSFQVNLKLSLFLKVIFFEMCGTNQTGFYMTPNM